MKINNKIECDLTNLFPKFNGISPNINGVDTIMGYLKAGFEIGDIHFSNYDDNTRFVILEKYPAKFKDPVYDNGEFSAFNFHINVEMKKPISYIETKFTIKKDGEIEYGV